MVQSKCWLAICGTLANGETLFGAVQPDNDRALIRIEVEPISSTAYTFDLRYNSPTLVRHGLRSRAPQEWTTWIAGTIAFGLPALVKRQLMEGHFPMWRTGLQKVDEHEVEKLSCSSTQSKKSLRLAGHTALRATVEMGGHVCLPAVLLAAVPSGFLLAAVVRSASRRRAGSKQAVLYNGTIATVASLGIGQTPPGCQFRHERRNDDHSNIWEWHKPPFEAESCNVHRKNAKCSDSLQAGAILMAVSPGGTQFHRMYSQEYDDDDFGGRITPFENDSCEFHRMHTAECMDDEALCTDYQRMHTQSLDSQDLMRNLSEFVADPWDCHQMPADQCAGEMFSKQLYLDVETGCCDLLRMYGDNLDLENANDASRSRRKQGQIQGVWGSGQELHLGGEMHTTCPGPLVDETCGNVTFVSQRSASTFNRMHARGLTEEAIAQHLECEFHTIHTDSSASETSQIESDPFETENHNRCERPDYCILDDCGEAFQRVRCARPPRCDNDLQCRHVAEPHWLLRRATAGIPGAGESDSDSDMPCDMEASGIDSAWEAGTQGFVKKRVAELDKAKVGVAAPELMAGDSFIRAVTLPPIPTSYEA